MSAVWERCGLHISKTDENEIGEIKANRIIMSDSGGMGDLILILNVKEQKLY